MRDGSDRAYHLYFGYLSLLDHRWIMLGSRITKLP